MIFNVDTSESCLSTVLGSVALPALSVKRGKVNRNFLIFALSSRFSPLFFPIFSSFSRCLVKFSLSGGHSGPPPWPPPPVPLIGISPLHPCQVLPPNLEARQNILPYIHTQTHPTHPRQSLWFYSLSFNSCYLLHIFAAVISCGMEGCAEIAN